jgi:uncharacterized protein (UPF0332 family)
MTVKNGIELIEPSDNLSKVYFEKSENALKATVSLKGNKEWEISSCYYSMYFALYGVMMKLGVKCENHACSIEFMKSILKNKFSKEEISLLSKSRDARVDIQYYTDKNISDELYAKMINESPKFIARCKEISYSLTEKEINGFREELGKLIEESLKSK